MESDRSFIVSIIGFFFRFFLNWRPKFRWQVLETTSHHFSIVIFAIIRLFTIRGAWDIQLTFWILGQSLEANICSYFVQHKHTLSKDFRSAFNNAFVNFVSFIIFWLYVKMYKKILKRSEKSHFCGLVKVWAWFCRSWINWKVFTRIPFFDRFFCTFFLTYNLL